MNHEDVQKVSNAANAKITLLQNNFLKYFMRAVMAGFFIVVAMIFSNVVGNVFAGAEEPAWGKFLGSNCVLNCRSSDLNGRRRTLYRKQPGYGIWSL